ncbi:MAG: aminoglycoside phosphotransferase [Rhodobacteraceae bacterium PARR1]|nr:MAG: aminoglycoside phosphotransferase [Rhodobacteraceae bacterium PARR1]
MTDRQALSDAFVARAGWGEATRNPLAGDASDRRYDRLTLGQHSAVLMDAPPGKGDDPADFIRIADHLASLDLSPPRILARDLAQGFLLLEDLGDRLVARETAVPAQEEMLYRLAVDVLIHLQSCPAPPDLPNLSAADWAAAAGFAPDWYRFAARGDAGDSADFQTELASLLTRHADGPRVLILRDYHAENLLWLPHRDGLRQMGLLDFQLGQMGQPGYDLVSLLQDARRDVPMALESALVQHFVTATGADPAAFSAAYAVLGAQRALRILGIFARLCLKGGKAGYLPLLPRVWGQLQRNLAHPDLADLRAICQSLLPEPTPGIIARIGAQCGMHPHR